MKYTEEVHARRLVKMLGKELPCHCCPAQRFFRSQCDSEFIKGAGDPPDKRRGNVFHDFIACKICNDFLGIERGKDGCPCYSLGNDKALELTRKKLKEKGYL